MHRWLFRPRSVGGAGLAGGLELGDGRAAGRYWVTLMEYDDARELWRVEKEGAVGPEQAYFVSVPLADPEAPVSCTCPGHRYRGSCRHGALRRALMELAAEHV